MFPFTFLMIWRFLKQHMSKFGLFEFLDLANLEEGGRSLQHFLRVYVGMHAFSLLPTSTSYPPQ